MLPQVQGISLDETWPWPRSWDITQQTPRGYLEKNSYGWYETWPHLVCVILSAGNLFDPYYIFMLNMINLTGKTCDTKQLNWEHNLSTLKKPIKHSPQNNLHLSTQTWYNIRIIRKPNTVPKLRTKEGAPHEGPRAPGCPDHPRLSSDK